MNGWLAWKLRAASSFLWRRGKLGETRYLGEVDLAMIQFVGALDRFANALDGGGR